MSATRRDFLSLDQDNASDDDGNPGPIQAHLDTLFAQFSRRRRSLSPSDRIRIDSPDQDILPISDDEEEGKVDLRALDYVSEYDSHLMCPICHVPFVDPVVLDCDHTFCTSCFKEYRTGASHSERSQCPTCRAYLLSRPHKASRLISNMCHDLRVRCPNEGCKEVVARGVIEQHVTKQCPETRLGCPGKTCDKMVKRKNFVPNQCIHSSHIECDCGAIIELGRGEWLKHKDEDCPATVVVCEHCEERISAKDYHAMQKTHICKPENALQECPGAEFGCTDDLANTDVETHIKSCPLARLAPALKKQASLLQSMTDQLTMVKIRNDVLESGIDKINIMINEHILPNLIDAPLPSNFGEEDDDIEEIPRQPPSPPPGPPTTLSLPAHLRPLTPTNADLLSLHSNLQDNISNLSNQVLTLQTALSELDARTSMTMMNETLRLKEDLAHQSAGLFSTRSQVQWLLQRERERMVHGQQMHQQHMAMRQQQQQERGRRGQPQPQPESQDAAMGTSPGTASVGMSASMSARSSVSTDAGDGVTLPSGITAAAFNASPFSAPNSQAHNPGFGDGTQLASAQAGPSSATPSGSSNVPRSPPMRSNTLPMPIPGMSAGMSSTGSGVGHASPRVRPTMRRLSGGSQERVKL
jgi:hypothetical protein